MAYKEGDFAVSFPGKKKIIHVCALPNILPNEEIEVVGIKKNLKIGLSTFVINEKDVSIIKTSQIIEILEFFKLQEVAGDLYKYELNRHINTDG